jgi:hypothetical protein
MTASPDSSRDSGSRKGLYIWLLFVFLALLVTTTVLVGWGVRHALIDGPRLPATPKKVLLFASNFPGLVRDAYLEVRRSFDQAPVAQLVSRATVEGPHWRRSFPAAEDTGYLLFSGIDRQAHHAIVKLLRISDGKEIARWDPDWPSIYDKISDKRLAPKGNFRNASALHPLLLPSGDIIFNTTHSLVRLNACSRTPAWVIDVRMHHSNEFDLDGTVWTPSEVSEAFADNPWVRDRIRDDSLAHITVDGRILENLSFTKILEANGLGAMVLGTTGWRLQPDPLHLNEINAAPSDGPYWKKGDLLISSRHLSTLFLYRPSTGRITWHKMGPWLNQHSPEFMDDHRISVFDNHVYSVGPNEFLNKGDMNRVLVYDFATGETSEPFKDLLTEARPMTMTQGRARILPDGGLFVEESNYGRLLRFTKDRLLWSLVNDYDSERIGMLTWSRYLTAEEAAEPLKALAQRPCPAS